MIKRMATYNRNRQRFKHDDGQLRRPVIEMKRPMLLTVKEAQTAKPTKSMGPLENELCKIMDHNTSDNWATAREKRRDNQRTSS
jgi:hypothetical protein